MTTYDDNRVVTLLREIEPPAAAPDRLVRVTRRARRTESRRATVLAGVMAVVLVAGVTSALSLRDTDPTEQLSVADAARATQDAGSARVTIRVVLSDSASAFLPDGELMKLTGPVDFRHQRLDLRGTFTKAPIEMRAIGKDRWTKSDVSVLPGAAASTPSKPWVHSVETGEKVASDFASMDPGRLLDVLTSQGTVVSTRQQGDRRTTVLRLSRSALIQAFGPDGGNTSPEVSVQTDEDGRIRQTMVRTELKGLGTTTGTVNYDDFGVEVHVTPPPADQVAEEPPSSTSGSQSFSVSGSSSPTDRKKACEQFEAFRKARPAPTNEQERQQQKQFDALAKQACPGS
jgi:hypothetical protein